MRKLALMVLPLLAGGCVAKAAWDVATLPVKAAGRTVDVLTVSPKERDEKWAREHRKAEERADRERRAAAKRERQRDRAVDDNLN